MTGFRESVPLGLFNLLEERLDDFILCFIIAAVDQQGMDLDLVEVLTDIECLERATDIEFGWTIPEYYNYVSFSANERHHAQRRGSHSEIHGIILLQPRKACL